MSEQLVGSPRACRHCGASIRFRQTYGADGTRKYLPANTDGTDHRCLAQNTKGAVGEGSGRPATEYDMILKMADAMNIPREGKSITDMATEIGRITGKTKAEVFQQAQHLLALENLQHGGAGVRASGGGSAESNGGDALDDLVDQAVEQALSSRQRGAGENSSKGEGSGEAGGESGSSSGNGEEGGNDRGSAEEGSGSTGDAAEGQGSGASAKGDVEGVPQSQEGSAGQEEAGEAGEEGGSAGEKAGEENAKKPDQAPANEKVEVDKDILKRIAQALKEQIKEETTQKHVVELKMPDSQIRVETTDEHYLFNEFIQLLVEREYPFLAGPAGSGKTTAALKAAPILGKALAREDYQTYVKSFCLMSGKHELEGFIDANGVCQDTDFRRAFTEGHLFFMDEVDAANPNVLLVLNAAIENGIMSFPDGMQRRHEHFRMGVGANTVGLGADAQYSGRTQLDAAFRNRFYFMAWEYDERMELKWAGEDEKEWVLYVQALRKAQQSMGKSAPRVVISPRASIRGARRLRSGAVTRDNDGFNKLADALIWQGCHEDDKQRILANVSGAKRRGR